MIMKEKIEQLKELLYGMLEVAKKDRRLLLTVKSTAVKCQQFELAANIREIETSIFPETEEQKGIKESVKKLQLVLQMVELKADEKTCYLLQETMKAYSKKKGKFSIREASEIIVKAKELFPVE